MKKLSIKAAKKIMKRDLVFTSKFTPAYLIIKGVISKEDWANAVCILLDDEYVKTPMLLYNELFETRFYNKVYKFLKTKNCKGLIMELPEQALKMHFTNAAEKYVNTQIHPLIHSVAFDK